MFEQEFLQIMGLITTACLGFLSGALYCNDYYKKRIKRGDFRNTGKKINTRKHNDLIGKEHDK